MAFSVVEEKNKRLRDKTVRSLEKSEEEGNGVRSRVEEGERVLQHYDTESIESRNRP